MAIFDFDYNPVTDHERQRYVVFKQGMSEYYYKTAMNSLSYLRRNRDLLPVYLPVCSLPPQLPNAWVQKERKLMDDMQDAFTAEMEVDDAKSAADLSFPLQHYERVFREGIVNLRPLFDHAKATPGAIVCYDGIEDSFKNALQKVEKWGRINQRRSARNKGGRNKHKKTKRRN